jgi:ribonuclease P protein component
VLARANRLVSAGDYRNAVRRGARSSAPCAVVYRTTRNDKQVPRFGFIVAKTVGVAVVRNRVRRRLKAVCYELLPLVPAGTDIVIRALPASAEESWATLRSEISAIVTQSGARA